MNGKPFPLPSVSQAWREFHAEVEKLQKELPLLEEVLKNKTTAARRADTMRSQAQTDVSRINNQISHLQHSIIGLEEEWNFEGFVRNGKK